MTFEFDVIVIGQGLAGTALAWWLRWMGNRVLVVDREATSTSSKIAAGLITPISGQKLVKAWRHAELWPEALSFYRRVECLTGSRVLRELAMVRLFQSDEDVAVFEQRIKTGEFDGLVRQPANLVNDEWFLNTHGGFEMSPGGQLDVPGYLRASKEVFCGDGGYMAIDVDVPRDIELIPGGVRMPKIGVSARRIVFCEGIDAIRNHWFLDVEFKPAKGEILTLRIPGLTDDRVIHRGIWLTPVGDELFKVGSNYEWKQLNLDPTPQARDEIISQLREFLRRPFEVISHAAAIRPIHRNQYPVVGIHPVHSQLGYFNGLGSKGSLQAPYVARHFASWLGQGGDIDPDFDLNHKTTWRSLPPGTLIGSQTVSKSARRSERRTNRPLTQQAQEAIGESLSAGDFAIDATAGNGHDTQFLAEQVGPAGMVFAFDIQQSALDATAKRLEKANLQNVVLLNEDHGKLLLQIPPEYHGDIGAVMFNLGYLPGGDKQVITRSDSTRSGIEQAAVLLRPGGLLTIVVYTGHDGGVAESFAVEEVVFKLSQSAFDVEIVESQPGRSSGPRLFLVKRKPPETEVG